MMMFYVIYKCSCVKSGICLGCPSNTFVANLVKLWTYFL